MLRHIQLPKRFVLALGVAATAATVHAQTVQPPPPSALRPYALPPVEKFMLANGLNVISTD